MRASYDIVSFCLVYYKSPFYINLHTLKTSVTDLKKRLKDYRLTQVPWCNEGFFVEGPRTDLGNLKEHQLGLFYVQEAASMIPPLILNPKQSRLCLLIFKDAELQIP